MTEFLHTAQFTRYKSSAVRPGAHGTNNKGYLEHTLYQIVRRLQNKTGEGVKTSDSLRENALGRDTDPEPVKYSTSHEGRQDQHILYTKIQKEWQTLLHTRSVATQT